MIRAVIFDLMGTLAVSTERDDVDWLASMYSDLVECGLGSEKKQLLEAWNVLKTLPSEEGHTPFEERIRRVALSLELDLGWSEVVSIANSVCLRSAGYLEVDDAGPVLIDALRSKRINTSLVSNYDHPPEIYRFLGDSGLGERLHPVIISGEVGIWKPDPRILNLAMEMIGVGPKEALYVGDSRVDVEVALAAGVMPAIIARQDGYADPFRSQEEEIETVFKDLIRKGEVKVIRDLGEVASLL